MDGIYDIFLYTNFRYLFQEVTTPWSHLDRNHNRNVSALPSHSLGKDQTRRLNAHFLKGIYAMGTFFLQVCMVNNLFFLGGQNLEFFHGFWGLMVVIMQSFFGMRLMRNHRHHQDFGSGDPNLGNLNPHLPKTCILGGGASEVI